MKLRKILAGLWIVLLLLAGTCYAENTENPIVYETENYYWRLNVSSVKKVEYLGHYYIDFQWTRHSYQVVPFLGTPYASEDGKGKLWIDPSNDEMVVDSESGWFDSHQQLDRVSLAMYTFIKRKFPNLVNEVIADNKIVDAKYKADVDNAEAAYNNDDWDAVYASLKKVYDNGCQTDTIISYLAATSEEMGDYDNAIEWYGKLIDVAPYADAYNRRAWLYYSLGKNDLALEDAKWATLKDKENANYLDTRGSIYYELGQYDKALADFNAALKKDDKFAHAHYYRGKCYEALGKKDDAQSDYKKAKNLDYEIVDDKVKFEKQRTQALAAKQYRQQKKQQEHQQKLNQYNEDLKKLNDAAYVYNNPENFPIQTVYESNGVIIRVVGRILNNEPKDFYEEVVPQEVRTNYENQTYQQKYEQLRAELGINTPSAAANEIGLKIGADGTILEAPTTLPTDSSKEIYDLQQPDALLRYTSEGSKYILTYEDPMITYRTLRGNEVTPIEQEHGRYMLRHVVLTGDPYPDFSFDYDRASHTYTLYGGVGAKRTVHYDAASDTITVNHLDGAYSDLSGTYVYVPEDDGYILYPRNYKLEANAVALAKGSFNGDSDIGKHYTVYYGPAIDLEVIAYPEYKEKRPNLPTMWYKMTNEEYPSEWIAFTYDKATGVFGMYDNDGKEIVNYAKRRFRDANHIETVNTGLSNFGAADGVYERKSDGTYRNSSGNGIYTYITDGMFNFMHYVKK